MAGEAADERRRSVDVEAAAEPEAARPAERAEAALAASRAHIAALEEEVAGERSARHEAEAARLAAEEAVGVVVSRAGGAEAERRQQLRQAQVRGATRGTRGHQR